MDNAALLYVVITLLQAITLSIQISSLRKLRAIHEEIRQKAESGGQS